MSDLGVRIARLEGQVRVWRIVSLLALLGCAAIGGWAARASSRPIVASRLVVTGANGARTIVEGGRLRLEEPSGNRLGLQASEQASSLTLSTPLSGRTAPEMVLRVGTSGTPASLLLSDRKARNFTHLYVNGTAGLEQAGVREYRNLATP